MFCLLDDADESWMTVDRRLENPGNQDGTRAGAALEMESSPRDITSITHEKVQNVISDIKASLVRSF